MKNLTYEGGKWVYGNFMSGHDSVGELWDNSTQRDI